MKKELFAQLLFDAGQRLSKEEICEQVGITLTTYYKWSRDPDLASLVIPDSWRMQEAAKIYTITHQLTALRTLVEVMENSRNDNARVRAAELMMTYNRYLDSHQEDVHTQEVAKLLQRHQPLLVNNLNVITMQTGSGPDPGSEPDKADDVEADGSVDGEYTVVGEDDSA